MGDQISLSYDLGRHTFRRLPNWPGTVALIRDQIVRVRGEMYAVVDDPAGLTLWTFDR